jgi:hypothetical protein
VAPGGPVMVALLLALVVAGSAACQTTAPPGEETPAPPQARAGQSGASLVTDSTQYTVRFVDRMYRARIGYTYTNRTGQPVSRNYCRTPPPPVLEKLVDGKWVRAYRPMMPACLTTPPFRIAPGATYRGTLNFAAVPPGQNAAPALEVGSVPGTYRLRWMLTAGNDPEAAAAATVEAISNEFRLIER